MWICQAFNLVDDHLYCGGMRVGELLTSQRQHNYITECD